MRAVTEFPLLLSYSYIEKSAFAQQWVRALKPPVRLMIDSGAFTVWARRLKAATHGIDHEEVQVTLDKYCDFAQSLDPTHEVEYIALDVIADRAATDRNLDTMLARGLMPLPVLVRSAPIIHAKQLASVNRRVAVAKPSRKISLFAQRLHQVNEVTDGLALTHALGYGRWPDIAHAPIFSGDTANWISGARFGHMLRFSPEKGLTSRHAHALHTEAGAPFRRALIESGISPAVLADAARYRGAFGVWVLAGVWAALQYWLAVAKTGRRLYFASTINQSRCLLPGRGAFDGRLVDWSRYFANVDAYAECVSLGDAAALATLIMQWAAQPMPYA